MDRDDFRQAAGHFASGVTVITAHYENTDYGITLSAMTSLSLDPPMLLICVNRTLPSHDAIKGSGLFIAHVLARHQEQVARQFAQPAPDKFHGIPTRPSSLGPPIIRNTLAHFACRVAHTIAGGTHTIFLSDVIEAETAPGLEPLLYYQGAFGRLGAQSIPTANVPAYLPPDVEDDLIGSGLMPRPFRLGTFYQS